MFLLVSQFLLFSFFLWGECARAVFLLVSQFLLFSFFLWGGECARAVFLLVSQSVSQSVGRRALRDTQSKSKIRNLDRIPAAAECETERSVF